MPLIQLVQIQGHSIRTLSTHYSQYLSGLSEPKNPVKEIETTRRFVAAASLLLRNRNEKR